MKYSLVFFLLLSCSLFEESKVHYFNNQLTPTINASLALFSAYIKCKKSTDAGNLSKFKGVTFTVKGRQDHFYLIQLTSVMGELNTCDQVVTFSPKEIPYQNQLTRWYDKEKKILTYDIGHGKLYNFNQMYVDTTYQFQITVVSENEIEVFIKRTDPAKNLSTQEIQAKGPSFYEQHSFRGILKTYEPVPVIYIPPGTEVEFSW
ncbi:MAG: hypothetical protein A2381_06955 [Bdellovibrionales bacterium RIFOXYB1_FULL_37_110]|nr:MAG: hypothetical protein A2417_14830 [Bdellovibrionales bacterium RIFOXYC1_FULL_37_79]OFZ57802.1 MAG: hypothetical protein A2381_06955 [Bdellovibrionales bacterium RIFOXYB1_FULL_37_110]OFZ62768.1 MAG: hypothetical protein A2577_16475 [Bdellovibrionales bacterium RIFOXYD1_FULL_36_51]